jgi:hypothetical protein
MIQVSTIIKRLKHIYNVDLDQELAEILGISQAGLSAWKKNNNFDIEKVGQILIDKGINLNWLLFDVKEPLINQTANKDIKDSIIFDLQDELKKTDIENTKDEKDVRILELENYKLRSQLEFAESLIRKSLKID